MRAFGKFLGRFIAVLAIVGAGLWAFGPYEPVEIEVVFDDAVLGDDVDAYFAQVEGQVADIQEGAQKRVVWAGEVGAKTEFSIVYFHGFSASSEEIRPVTDDVAARFGANLIYTRFNGHGIKNGGAALAGATVGDWMFDAAEALAVARAVGERVIIMSTSTGGTIAAQALLQPDLARDVAAVVFVSPNFEINNSLAFMLTWPAARYWLPLVAGAEQDFSPISAAHGKFWTLKYPTTAAMALGALVKYARAQDYNAVTVPALFYYSDADKVVKAQANDAVFANWGGATRRVHPVLGDGVDPNGHVVIGDIRSPNATAGAVIEIAAWLDEVLQTGE